jgi:rhamnosyl/mannosyltransferase
MRILHLYKDYYPVLGGIENHVCMLAEAQASLGHDVTVLVTSLDGRTREERLNSVRVIYAARLANISSAPLSTAWARLLERERPDIAHLHFPYPPGEIANLFFGHATRTVLTYHSDIVRQKYLRLAYAPFMSHVLTRVDAIIATSPNYIASSAILSRWKSKTVVIPLGIDPGPFLTAPAEQPGSNTLLFVGRLRYYKGLNYLLDALPSLPETRLIIVGTGQMERAWRDQADRLGLSGRVEWRGDVPDADLPACYAAASVFVLPASERSEAFGTVQLEAMASARPVVSCDVGTGVGWVNRDEMTGLVVPPRDPAVLSQALARLLADKVLREKMGTAGRQRVLEEFTLDKMVGRVMDLYSRLLS